MRRLLLCVLFALVLLPAYPAEPALAKHKSPAPVAAMLPPVGDYPDAPCEDPDVDGGNFYLSPTGDFWECICEHRTFIKDDCAWYNQGPINQPESRRLKAKLHRKKLPLGHLIDTVHWRVIP